VEIDSGDLARRDQRDADAPERHGRGVRDETQARGVVRVETKADEHARRNRHRRAEPGGALEKRAEAERDEQRLQPTVVSQRRDRLLDHLEAARANRNLIQQHCGVHDPADGKHAVERAVQCRQERQLHGHSVDDDREAHGERQREQSRADARHALHKKRPQQDGDRHRSDRGRQERDPERIEDFHPHEPRF
jgi:hypothetical protein